MTPSGIVAFLSDFGPGSLYVGEVHAVLARRAPSVRVLDLAHDLPPGGVEAAAEVLRRAVLQLPPGTVHLAVVDPGVGGPRALLAARAGGHLFAAPDNGLLAPVLAEDPGAEVRRLGNPALRPAEASRTFHGRDLLAPLAAALATGLPLAEAGPPAAARALPPSLSVAGRSVSGTVLFVDRFGNLLTNVPRREVERLGPARALRVRVGAEVVEGLAGTFSDAPEGGLLAYVGSGGRLEVAVNLGSAAARLGAGPGTRVVVEGRDG